MRPKGKGSVVKKTNKARNKAIDKRRIRRSGQESDAKQDVIIGKAVRRG